MKTNKPTTKGAKHPLTGVAKPRPTGGAQRRLTKARSAVNQQPEGAKHPTNRSGDSHDKPEGAKHPTNRSGDSHD